MKDKFFSFITGVSAFSFIGFTPTTIGVDISDILIWTFRTIGIAFIGIITYFLKGLIDDNKESNKRRDDKLDLLIKLTAAHEVMYRIWLDEMAEDSHPETGNRRSDKLYRLIQSVAEVQKDG